MTVLLIGPVLVALAGAAALSAGRPNAPRTAAAAVAASALHLLCACVVLGRVWAAGPLDAALLSVDRVNGVLWVLVAGMGVVVTAYSRTYLADDEGQARFTAWLSWTLAAVTGIVLAGHLVLLFAAWTITSFTMHRLLRFFPDRPAAELAARKKFVVSRLGDLSLLAAGWWLWQATGSLDIDVVQAGARAVAADGAASWHWHAAGIALAVAAIFKSAQFPVHGWLLEVMETPTPVSALLHAGVINAGGILLIRSSDVLMVAPIAGDLLVLIGGMTAIVGSLVMLTQTSIKVALAYSTVAQMGFMLLQCGLGAFAAATLHIVAHSCYKAHAFLSSGSVVALAQSSWLPTRLMRPHPWRAVIATAVLAMLALASATWFSERLWLRPEMLALAAIVAMGVTLLMAQSLDAAPNRRVLLRITAMGAAVVGVYVGLQAAVGVAFGATLPPPPISGAFDLAMLVIVLVAFAALTVFQLQLPARQEHPAWRAWYWHVANGFYANTLANRLARRWWLRVVPRVGHHGIGAPPLPVNPPPAASASAIRDAVVLATQRIAPVWPLKNFVAVNPFLGFTDRPFRETHAYLRRVVGQDILMPREYFVDAVDRGDIALEDIQASLADEGHSASSADAAALLERVRRAPRPEPSGHVVATVADVLDARAIDDREPSRALFMTEEIARFCAAYFDEGQALWRMPERRDPLFSAWKAAMRVDRNAEVMGIATLRAVIDTMPDDPHDAVVAVVQALRVPESAVADYLYRALFDVRGWAAYLRHRSPESVAHLLAIRVVWGYALFEERTDPRFRRTWWAAMMDAASSTAASDDEAVQDDLVIAAAMEAAYRRRLEPMFVGAQSVADDRPEVQAVFCIDVRSEPYRRALEATDRGIATIGFAGFFGVPMEYVPLGLDSGPAHCPVLISPSVRVQEASTVSDGHPGREIERRLVQRRCARAWKVFKTAAVSSFTYVETFGLSALGPLFRHTLGWSRPAPHAAHVRPDLSGITLETRIQMAQQMLRGMSLSAPAPLVLLVGHGSSTLNNPHATSLDCGACGGQTGEASARVAALLLNDPAVREAVGLPADTVFVAALHDTTTDDVRVCDRELVPPTHQVRLARVEVALKAASAQARRARAPRLGLRPEAADSVRQRAQDWAQVRPEWGLAGNAAFIAAPRARTAHHDLSGRAFLHSYDWRQDPDHAVLELIMTAPMIVASWINLQYYGSTVCPAAWGAGNKTIHNVTGTLGVVLGNGGDLQTGLPLQSVHDGRRWVHEPIRLQVYIEAPRAAIDGVLEKHPSVRDLVANGWVALHHLNDNGAVERIRVA